MAREKGAIIDFKPKTSLSVFIDMAGNAFSYFNPRAKKNQNEKQEQQGANNSVGNTEEKVIPSPDGVNQEHLSSFWWAKSQKSPPIYEFYNTTNFSIIPFSGDPIAPLEQKTSAYRRGFSL
ncbi:MAG: hypothetical protein ABIT05_01305 [Chitinophagaceae bacterium]